jgi:hypothetical protein
MRAARAAIGLGLLWAAALPPAPGVARGDEPAAAASQAAGAAQADPAFLDLPAYDVDRVDGGARVRVGDAVILRVGGLMGLPGVKEPQRDLKLEVPPGTDNLTDLGWELDPSGAQPVPPGELRVKATPLKPGRITLPSLAIKNAEGKALARTNPFALDVESAIAKDDPKPDQPAELRPPVSLRFPWWVLAAAGVLSLAAVALLVYWLRHRKRPVKARPAEPAPPPKPEDEVALAALAVLERDGPLKRGEFKQHYFRLSEIVKAYIGARYRFDAVESTTREMIGLLEERRSLSDAQIDRLETLFEKLDLVKFTDHVPVPDEGLRLVEVARELVMATRRPPEVLPAGPAGPGSAGGAGAQAGGARR